MKSVVFSFIVAGIAVAHGSATGSIVEARPGYNSWPMIQAIGDRLVCAYSRGSAHTIGEGARGVLARTSPDGGKTWSGEVCVVNDPDVGEVTVGKGLDNDGAMLLWVRNWGTVRRHDLYRTQDGVTFEKIASPRLSPMPMQITDVFQVPGVGLMSLWFAGDYKTDGGHSWGTLTSADNGCTWAQRIVEAGLSRSEWPTEQSAVWLGGGRILAVARCEKGGKCQFQLTSTDGGVTWKREATNIKDVMESTPSLIYEPKTGMVFNYYYQRGAKKLKCRKADARLIFSHPDAWPAPDVLFTGNEERPYDAGNVNATVQKGVDHLALYSGTQRDTTVMVITVDRKGLKDAAPYCIIPTSF